MIQFRLPLNKDKKGINAFRSEVKSDVKGFLKEKISSQLDDVAFDWSKTKALSKTKINKYSYQANHDIFVAA